MCVCVYVFSAQLSSGIVCVSKQDTKHTYTHSIHKKKIKISTQGLYSIPCKWICMRAIRFFLFLFTNTLTIGKINKKKKEWIQQQHIRWRLIIVIVIVIIQIWMMKDCHHNDDYSSTNSRTNNKKNHKCLWDRNS